MLPTDAELVDAAAATYGSGKPVVQDQTGTVRVFLTGGKQTACDIFAIEGTHDPLGWGADFFALRVWDHPGRSTVSLGWVHAGFYALAAPIIPLLVPLMQRYPYAIAGHSLGAALALLIGATMISKGKPPVKIGAFAPPRVGDAKFVKVATSVPFCAYKYGNDPVPDVPWHIPFFFPYRQIPLTMVGAPKASSFKCHAIENYVAAVHGMGN